MNDGLVLSSVRPWLPASACSILDFRISDLRWAFVRFHNSPLFGFLNYTDGRLPFNGAETFTSLKRKGRLRVCPVCLSDFRAPRPLPGRLPRSRCHSGNT